MPKSTSNCSQSDSSARVRPVVPRKAAHTKLKIKRIAVGYTHENENRRVPVLVSRPTRKHKRHGKPNSRKGRTAVPSLSETAIARPPHGEKEHRRFMNEYLREPEGDAKTAESYTKKKTGKSGKKKEKSNCHTLPPGIQPHRHAPLDQPVKPEQRRLQRSTHRADDDQLCLVG